MKISRKYNIGFYKSWHCKLSFPALFSHTFHKKVVKVVYPVVPLDLLFYSFCEIFKNKKINLTKMKF